MSTIFLSTAIGVLTFGLAILGMYLHLRLPEHHMAAGSRGLIDAVKGLVSLLLALVLGALVSSAYGFFATQKANIETLGAHCLQLDIALSQYGPDAQPIRDELKGLVAGAYRAIDSDSFETDKLSVKKYIPKFRQLNEQIASLKAQTPEQLHLISTIQADTDTIERTRLLMSLQLASPVSWPLLIVVVSWAMLLFFGFGVLSQLNATSIAAVALGAFAVASAIFLILELNQPFSGHLRIPIDSIKETLNTLGT